MRKYRKEEFLPDADGEENKNIRTQKGALKLCNLRICIFQKDLIRLSVTSSVNLYISNTNVILDKQ